MFPVVTTVLVPTCLLPWISVARNDPTKRKCTASIRYLGLCLVHDHLCMTPGLLACGFMVSGTAPPDGGATCGAPGETGRGRCMAAGDAARGMPPDAGDTARGTPPGAGDADWRMPANEGDAARGTLPSAGEAARGTPLSAGEIERDTPLNAGDAARGPLPSAGGGCAKCACVGEGAAPGDRAASRSVERCAESRLRSAGRGVLYGPGDADTGDGSGRRAAGACAPTGGSGRLCVPTGSGLDVP